MNHKYSAVGFAAVLSLSSMRSDKKDEWSPPTDFSASEKWAVIVRNAREPVRWGYMPHFFCAGAWERGQFLERDHQRLRAFAVTLAVKLAERHDRLWNDLIPEASPLHKIGCFCCDFRLLNFDPTTFSASEVLSGIVQFAEATRERIGSPRSGGPNPQRPQEPFDYTRIAGATFGIGWYYSPLSLSWPNDGNFWLMPEVDRKERLVVEAAKWRDHLAPIATQAVAAVPELAILDAASLPARPSGTRGRAGAVRNVNGIAVAEDIRDYLRYRIEPVHDIVLSGVQAILDRLRGNAAPYLEGNVAITEAIREALSRCGGFLFSEHNGALVRTSLTVRELTGTKYPAAASALAGLFLLDLYNADDKRIHMTTSATFPELIVARDQAQAELIRAARARQ